MPRKTTPRVAAKHSRAHIRHQAQRWAMRRFRRDKATRSDAWALTTHYDYEPGRRDLVRISDRHAPVFVHPDTAQRNPHAHPDSWFARSLHEWSCNFMTYCSCRGCTHDDDPARRQKERMDWQREWHDEQHTDSYNPGDGN